MGSLDYAVMSVLAIAGSQISTAAEAQEVPASEPSATANIVAAEAAVATKPSTVEDIVVTARKRDERLIDVPVAVSAVSNATLGRLNLTSLTAISTAVPALLVSRVASSAGASLTIRGIGTSFNDAGVDQAVSLNIDGLQGARGFITGVAFFDLAQVEVLKGPQALFFGKNSPAGVVSITSNDPTPGFFASVKAGYEFVADERYVEAIASGPVTSTFGARLALRYEAMDGYFKNRAVPEANPFNPAVPLPGSDGRSPDSHSLTGRLTLQWKPESNFSATFKALANHYHDNGLTKQFQPVNCAPGTTAPTSAIGAVRVADPTGDCKADKYQSIGDLPAQYAVGFPGSNGGKLFSNSNSLVTTLALKYGSGPISATSITGYTKTTFHGFGNNDQTSFATVTSTVYERSHLFTQELRAISDLEFPLNFAAGVYYENGNRLGTVRLRGPATPKPDPVTGNTFLVQRDGAVDSQAYSAFVQGILKIHGNIELAGGARFSHEKKDITEGNSYVAAGNPTILPQGVVLSNNFRDNNVSPEATLSWHPRRNLTLYAAYKTGYLSGGASIPSSLTATATSAAIGFGPETGKGGEIGFKGTVDEGRLTFSSDVFNYKYKGLQLVSQFISNGIPVVFVQNAATARTKGVEAEVNFQATSHLGIKVSGIYNIARILSYPNAVCYNGQTAAQGCRTDKTQDLAGYPLSRAPEWSLLGNINYAIPLAGDKQIGLSVDGHYSSSYRSQDDGTPQAVQGAYATIDATASLRGRDGKWELSIFGRNLTDKYYFLVSNNKSAGLAGDLYATVQRGRQIGIQGTIKY